MGVDGGIRGASGSLTGENVKLCGKGVCISQEPGGSSHQAPSGHKSATDLLDTMQGIHTHFTQDTPSGSTSCFTMHQTRAVLVVLVPPTLMSTTYQEG